MCIHCFQLIICSWQDKKKNEEENLQPVQLICLMEKLRSSLGLQEKSLFGIIYFLYAVGACKPSPHTLLELKQLWLG